VTVPGGRAARAAMILVPVALVLVLGLVTAGGDGGLGPEPPSEGNRGRERTRAIASAEDPLTLWVGGDSLAAGPSWAVFEAANATGVVTPTAEYQVGTGLVRDEYWDWTRHVDAVLRARNPDVAVFMVGANDNQPLAVDGVSYPAGSPEWVTEYRRRVAATMDALTRRGRTAIWIGMPPMRDPAFSAAMSVVNGVFAEEAAAHGVTYIDAYTLFSQPGQPGVYIDAVPTPVGPVSVRLDDGIHLNVDGSRYVATVVLNELVALGLVPEAVVRGT
jgi:uncharacterized protein